MGVFSAYYNFYFELCKRLKQRMKENRKNFKFRKIYSRSRNAVPTATKTTKTKTGKTSIKKIIRKKPGRSASATVTKAKTKKQQ